MKCRPRRKCNQQYQIDLNRAIARFLRCPAPKIHRITYEDMRNHGRTDPGFAREGNKGNG